MAEAIHTLKRVLELGIDFIDTAVLIAKGERKSLELEPSANWGARYPTGKMSRKRRLGRSPFGDEGFTASMAPCRRDREAEDVQMASGKG